MVASRTFNHSTVLKPVSNTQWKSASNWYIKVRMTFATTVPERMLVLQEAAIGTKLAISIEISFWIAVLHRDLSEISSGLGSSDM